MKSPMCLIYKIWSAFPTSIYTHLGPFYQQGLTLIPAWLNHHFHSKVWDEITYPFLNFNGATAEVWEGISNFFLSFKMDVITYPPWD